MAPAAATIPAFASAPSVRFGPVAAWLTWPGGALVQFLEPVRGTVEIANWLVGPAFAQLDAAFPRRSGLVLVLDLSQMVGRSAVARSIVLAKARAVRGRFARVVLVPPLVAPPMYLQSLRVTFLLLRSLGIATEFAESSETAIERLGLRPHLEETSAFARD